MGINPILSGARTEDEGLFVIQHSNWSQRMSDAIAAERKTAPAGAVAAE